MGILTVMSYIESVWSVKTTNYDVSVCPKTYLYFCYTLKSASFLHKNRVHTFRA